MMQIVYFSQKERFLAETKDLAGEVVFVAPSPSKADGLRARLLTQSSQDVITIAKFTSNLIEKLWDTDAPEVKRKSELLLIFGILKNKYFPGLGFEQFTQAYNLFSDLRSFTLNQEALTSVLDEQPEEIKRAVQLFWQLLDVTGYQDEHGAYQLITEALRSREEIDELKKTYIFWGFQHLNGQQVDLLKALAIRYQVIVPFPLELKDKLKRSDWLSWLRDSQVSEEELPSDSPQPKARLVSVNSREIALNLKHFLQEDDQVILGVSKISPLHLDMIPSCQVNYKIPHQLVQAELSELYSELAVALSKDQTIISTKELLSQLWASTLKNRPGSFKKLKAIQLYQEALAAIEELTDEVVQVDGFFLKLMNEVVMLNQPRTSFVTMSEVSLSIELKDMSSLDEIKRDRRVLLCIDERFEEIQGLGQNYTEAIQKSLSSLGPLKRNELELLFKQWEFRDLFSHAEVLVLMSESTLKHSLVWKKLFNDIELSPHTDRPVQIERQLKDHFKDIEKKSFDGSFSASKFQTFMDCPRKFYFSYVDKVFPSIALEKDFDPLLSGTIIHEIIEKFHKQNRELSELPKLTSEIMQFYINENGLNLPQEIYLKREIIFNQRARNGVLFLKQLSEVAGEEIEWRMEEEFHLTDDYILRGKIDCIGLGEKNLFLLDFKSTKYSASSTGEIEHLESLQLWTYAKAASRKILDFKHRHITLGFVVLDDPSDSNLLTNDDSLFDSLKASKLCKQKMFKESFEDIFQKAQEKMSALTLAIKSEKVFPARPRKTNACHFCELTKVCVKSEVEHD
jgi:CRISPR/Cas system-associated exonuclease Cas4 (RecB family)